MSLSDPEKEWRVNLPAVYKDLSVIQRRTVRREYMRLQHWSCMFCGHSLFSDAPQELKDLPIDWDLFPPGFLDYDTHLQHNHQTGLTEGAVHSFCNAFMWNYYRR
jgi:hypothetical protein